MKYTPERIESLLPTEVFVFGTNQYGKHAGGAAAIAQEKFGAIDAVPIGLAGKTYGIITTSYSGQVMTLDFIRDQVKVLYQFATYREELTFYVTKIGTGIAGYMIEDIANVFLSLESSRPSNIILPIEFTQQ
ncbi:MAG: A1S_2505 family phage non-structural protein [Pseudobacter sp.]|uniref:A1S_2505 family phage non-structural protein n=1 Tax=Pseudobacter sp. TaxID=2045420 RepID=UPI003F7F2317